MRNRAKLCWAMLGVTIVLGLCYVILRSSLRWSSAKLPDGRILTLEQVSYGKTNSFDMEPAWSRPLRKRLPFFFHRFLPELLGGGASSGPQDELVFFLTLFDPDSGSFVQDTYSKRFE